MKIFINNFFKNLSILDLLPFRTFTRAFMIRQWLNHKETRHYNHLKNKENIIQKNSNNKCTNETNICKNNNKTYFVKLNKFSHKYLKCKFNNDNIYESILIYIYDNHGNCLMIQQTALISINTSVICNQNITIKNNNYIIKPYFKCTLIKTLCTLLYNKNLNSNSFQLYSFIYTFSINPSLFNYLYYIFKNKHQYIISY